jgi:hypothetical protein
MKQKINTRIDPSVWNQVLELSRLQGLKIWYIVEIAILEYLEKQKAAKK